MKKITMIFGVAAMVLFAACEKQDIEPATKIITLSASMAQVAADTKTVFGEDGKSIEWVGGEQILVMDKNGVKATLTATVPGKTTTITGEVPAGFVETEPYYAFYPADKFGDVSLGSYIKLTIPATQANINGIVNGANPSYAKVDGAGMVSFQNICSIVKITVKAKEGFTALNTIALRGAGEKLGGTFNFYYESGTIIGSSAVDEVTINTNWTPSAVDETKSVYFVVKPFKAFMYVTPNGSKGKAIRTDELKVFDAAGTIYNMPELTWGGGDLTK